MTIALNRRHVLAGLGALTVTISLPGKPAHAALTTTRLPLKGDQLATYISIDSKGDATGWIGKIDMGQGTDVGWAQMIAEELDLPLDRVAIVQGDTDVTINMGGASGSTGILQGGIVMRVANSVSGMLMSDSSRSSRFNLLRIRRFFSPFSNVMVIWFDSARLTEKVIVSSFVAVLIIR